MKSEDTEALCNAVCYYTVSEKKPCDDHVFTSLMIT